MAKSLISSLTYKTKNRWRSVDAQFQNRVRSVSLSVLPTMEASTLCVNVCDQSPCRVTITQSQTLLMHRWPSFSEWGRVCVTVSSAYECSLYLIYERLYPIATQITEDARPNNFPTALPLIVRMGQRAWLTRFWLYRQPIHQKGTTIYQCQYFATSNRISECNPKYKIPNTGTRDSNQQVSTN